VHRVLLAAAEALGLSSALPALRSAAALSDSRIALGRRTLAPFCGSGLDVIAFGSLARREVTQESDFDYLVLATELPDEPEGPGHFVNKPMICAGRSRSLKVLRLKSRALELPGFSAGSWVRST
jgi:hypothetical protein